MSILCDRSLRRLPGFIRVNGRRRRPSESGSGSPRGTTEPARSGRIRQAAERVPGGGMAAFSPSPLGSVPAETGHWSAPLGAEPAGWAHGGIAEGAGPDLDPGREAPLGPCGAWWRGKGGERPGYSTA